MKVTREIKTAILVIASILLFIWGYSFLKGKELFTNYTTLYVVYDNVEGLSASAPITLNGLLIGKVSGITIDETSGKLKVSMQIKTDFPISRTSVAVMYSPNIIGGKQIAIRPNFEDKELVQDDQFLTGSIEVGLTDSLGAKIEPIQKKLEHLMVNVDSLVQSLNNVLDKKGQDHLKKSLAELSQTMEQFHKASTSVNSILDQNKSQINGMVTNFNKVSSNFSKISDSLNKADLGKTVRSLNHTLAKVDVLMGNLESGKGTAGKLLKDESLYNNLNSTSQELDLLLQDLRLNPTRYVNISLFGKKNKPYIAPVNDSISNKN